MPRDIRLALRIRGDYNRWHISSEDPTRYEGMRREQKVLRTIFSPKHLSILLLVHSL